MKQFEKRFEFDEYTVIMRDNSLSYEFPSKKHGIVTKPICTHFDITIDDDKDGGKIQINWIDRWGSEMQFIHYQPSSLKGMFDFLKRGFDIHYSETKN